MSDDRIDIILQDKISPEILNKLREIATLADSGEASIQGLQKGLGGFSSSSRHISETSREVDNLNKLMAKSEQLAMKTNLRVSFNEQKDAIREVNTVLKEHQKDLNQIQRWKDAQHKSYKADWLPTVESEDIAALRAYYTELEQVSSEFQREQQRSVKGLWLPLGSGGNSELDKMRSYYNDLEVEIKNTARETARQEAATAKANVVVNRYAGSVRTLEGIHENYRLKLMEVRKAYLLSDDSIERLTSAERNLASIRDQQIARWKAYNSQMEGTGDAAQFSRHHILNLGYQVQDLIVGFASGQKPMTVFVQQGAQIAGIAASAGVGIKGLTVAMWGLVAPFAPLVAGVAALGLVFYDWKKELNDTSGIKDYIDNLQLTTKQSEDFKRELKELGGETITTGDSFKAFFIVLDDYFGTTKTFDSWKDHIAHGFRTVYKEAFDGFVQWGSAIAAVRKTMDDFENNKIGFGDFFSTKAYQRNYWEIYKGFYDTTEKIKDKAKELRTDEINKALVSSLENGFLSSIHKSETALEKLEREHKERLQNINAYSTAAGLDPWLKRDLLAKEQAGYQSKVTDELNKQNKKILQANKYLSERNNKNFTDDGTQAYNKMLVNIEKIKQLQSEGLIDKQSAKVATQVEVDIFTEAFAQIQAEAAATAAKARKSLEALPLSVIKLDSDYKSLWESTRTGAEKADIALKSQIITLQTMRDTYPDIIDQIDEVEKRLQQNANPFYAKGAGAVKNLADEYKYLKEAAKEGYVTQNQFNASLRDLTNQEYQLAALRGQWGDGRQFTFGDAMTGGLVNYVSDFKGGMAEMLSISNGFWSSFADGAADAFASSVVYGDSMKDSMHQLSQTILTEGVASLAQLGIKYALAEALGQKLTLTQLLGIQQVSAAKTVATTKAVTENATIAASAAPAATAEAGATFGMSALAGAAALGALVAMIPMFMKGFASGGYTGDIPRNKIAGVTHGQEMVIHADATARNRPYLEAINRGEDVSEMIRQGASVSPVMTAEGRESMSNVINGGNVEIHVHNEVQVYANGDGYIEDIVTKAVATGTAQAVEVAYQRVGKDFATNTGIAQVAKKGR